jgi:hypothetical protein
MAERNPSVGHGASQGRSTGAMDGQPPRTLRDASARECDRVALVEAAGEAQADDGGRRRAWAVVREAYAVAASGLSADDPDRALMLRLWRHAGELAALPALVLIRGLDA